MLVDNNVYKNVYKGNGSTTAFPISFPFLDNTHIQVLQSSDGVNEEVVPSTEYTITGAGVEKGGTCTFNVAPPADITIAVMRNVPITQLYAYRELDNFPAESHENALAKLTMICQQLSERLARAVTVGATEAMTPEELRTEFFRIFNEVVVAESNINTALGNLFSQVIEPFTTVDGTLDYTVGDDIILDPDANNLLLSLGGVVQEPDASYTITGKNTIHFNSNPGDGIRCWGISCLSFSNPDIRAIVEKAIAKIQAEGDTQAARAEKFADAAEVSASSAASDAADVAANKAHVDTVAGEVKNLQANATTLDSGRPATASYNAETGTLELGIPKGDPGSSAIMTGATETLPGTQGAVPAPAAGQHNDFLRGDGKWAPVPALFKGAIISYSGQFQDKNPKVDDVIYTDWTLCDGTNGTPNLIDKFIRGTNADGIGGTGGADSQTVSIPVKGTVSGLSVGATTLSINQMPSHMHSLPIYNSGNGLKKRGLSTIDIDNTFKESNYTGGSQSHTHSISGTGTISGTSSATVDTIPSYYALAYIMKIS